jgi:hypothetical protein
VSHNLTMLPPTILRLLVQWHPIAWASIIFLCFSHWGFSILFMQLWNQPILWPTFMRYFHFKKNPTAFFGNFLCQVIFYHILLNDNRITVFVVVSAWKVPKTVELSWQRWPFQQNWQAKQNSRVFTNFFTGLSYGKKYQSVRFPDVFRRALNLC